MNRRPSRPTILGLCLLLLAPATARAGIGGGGLSVDVDRARLRVRASAVASGAGWQVHTLTLPDGVVVREYVNAADVVFAVSWAGPYRPDLQTLLGPKFDQVQADNGPTAGLRRRSPLRVNRPDFRMVTGGRPGAFWGRAALPDALPAGFGPGDFQ